MRILLLSWRDLAHPQAGGSEVLIDRLARGLVQRGHEVALMAGSPVGSRDYPVVPLGGTYAQYLRAPVVHARQFRRWDVVVDVENGIPWFSPLWRRGASLCLVHHVHTDQWALRFPPPVATFGRFLESRTMPKVYRGRIFVAVSQSTADALVDLRVPRDDIRILRPGVDPTLAPGPKTLTPQFLALGRLVPHKRLDLLLRAWERVRRDTGGHLVIAGDGPEFDRLVRLAGPDVVFTGRVTDDEKAKLLAESWLLVHTASHEGWGLVVTEAGSAGTPALAFDAPGVRESVSDGVTGALVRSEDELVATWVALTRDAPRRASLARAAHDAWAGFGWEAAVDDVLAAIGDALQRQGVAA